MPESRPYRSKHVTDIVIEDEAASNGRKITIHVDTLGMVNIEFGSSMTIRTDESGIKALKDALFKADSELLSIKRIEENTHGWPC